MPAYRSRTFIQASFWVAAILVGAIGVLFDLIVHEAQALHERIVEGSPLLMAAVTPLLFLASTALVVKIAPYARGSGIPQALKAMMISMGSHRTAMTSGLISLKTAAVKIASASIAILAGASIGREGPTVQISAAIFAAIGSRTKKIFPHADFHSYLVAGSAAGVAAAFNTPLAGISFALEEMAEGTFAQIKQNVMVSVIIAGIVSQTLVGNYLFFGHPALSKPNLMIGIPAIVLGVVGGLMGGVFARILAYPVSDKFKITWWQKTLICGVIVAAINYFTSDQTAGTGYGITKQFMDSPAEIAAANFHWYFPFLKAIGMAVSFISGMAGGIFSPSLAIGASLGSVVGDLMPFVPLKACALLGMVAFFTGLIQAPLTGVIIVMEMTDVHEFILPLMVAAFIAQGVGKAVMPTSLYRFLAHHRM